LLRQEQYVSHDTLYADWVAAPEVCFTTGFVDPSLLFPTALKSESEFNPVYVTRWRAEATIEQLLTDEQVRKVAFAKARSIGYTDQDAEDCVQLGSINLWKALQEKPALLADKGPAWVGIWIAFAGSRRALWKHDAHTASDVDPTTDDRDAGQGMISSQRNRPEPWATWATRVDEQIDFEILMRTLAERYEDDHLKLLALYALTTSVKMKDVAAVAGVDKKRFAAVAGNEVKKDIRQLLEGSETKATEIDWNTPPTSGGDLEYVRRVAEQVQENQRLLLALYIVTTSATRKDVTDLFGIGLTAFRKEITQIKMMLSLETRKATYFHHL
jgi:hypothetical protein